VAKAVGSKQLFRSSFRTFWDGYQRRGLQCVTNNGQPEQNVPGERILREDVRLQWALKEISRAGVDRGNKFIVNTARSRGGGRLL
jgi:hypothetical protein